MIIIRQLFLSEGDRIAVKKADVDFYNKRYLKINNLKLKGVNVRIIFYTLLLFSFTQFNGENLASGVYIYRLSVKPFDGGGGFVSTKKLILLK